MNEDDGEIEKRIKELDKQLTEKKPQLIQPRANNLIYQAADDDQPIFGGLFQQVEQNP